MLDYQAFFLKGQIEEALGNPIGAYESYQTARERLEALRSILWGEDLKIAFMRTKLEVYERLVDLCMRRDDGEGAASEIFGYIEQAKSRSLRDLFFERVPIAVAAAGPTELVRQIRTLREELNWHYHRVEIEQLRRDEGSAERLDTLQARLRRREETFIHVLREMPSDKREAAGLHGTGVASLEEIRTVMRPGMVLVEYFRTADRVMAVVLTENQLEIIPVTTVPRIRQLLGLLQFQLAKFLLPSEYVGRVANVALPATQAHLRELHAELLAPLDLPVRGHLVIVPHDLLHYVPFHALYDGERYVIDAHTVSYAPSAAIYRLCCRRQVATSGASLILSGPTATPHLRGDIILNDAKLTLPTVGEKAPGEPASIELEADVVRGIGLTIMRMELVIPPLRVPLKGKIVLGNRFSIDAEVATGTVSLSSLPEWINKGGIEAGNFEVSMDIKGSDADWKNWRTSGWVALTNGLMSTKGLDGQIEDLYVRLKFSRNHADIKQLSFRIKDSDLTLSGSVRNWTTKPLIAAKIESSQMDIDLLIPKGERSAIREFLEFLAATSHVSATASIEKGYYKHLRFGGVSGRLAIQDGVLDLDRVAGQSGTGQIAGRLVVHLPRQAPAETEGSLRMTGIPFESLFPLLGARAAAATGEVKLTGVLRGHGRNPHGVLPTLNGKIEIVAQEGHILKLETRAIWKILSILNLPAVLQGKVDFDKEGLQYNRTTATLTIQNGLMQTQNFIIDSPVVKITAAGQLRYADRSAGYGMGRQPIRLLLPISTINSAVRSAGGRRSQGSGHCAFSGEGTDRRSERDVSPDEIVRHRPHRRGATGIRRLEKYGVASSRYSVAPGGNRAGL